MYVDRKAMYLWLYFVKLYYKNFIFVLKLLKLLIDIFND
jgi:hypothetical protein